MKTNHWKGRRFDLIVSHITELGINVIINEMYKGLMYKDGVYDDTIHTGGSHAWLY
jgi:predicted RNA-binding protein (virulence factor B family)